MIHKSYKGSPYERRPWTKEELVKLINTWNSKTPEELQEKFQRPYPQLAFMAYSFREKGVKLDKKRLVNENSVANLIKQVVAEL